MNIQKYFSSQRILSRREAEKLAREKRIKVNGNILRDLGMQIDPEKDKVEIIGEIQEKITILFNKPRGISSSKIEHEGKNIFSLLPQFKNLNAVGRLDKESEGLILLSDDGVLTNIITGSEHLIEKEYIVEVYEKVSASKIKALSQGMMLNDGPTLPTIAKILSENSFSIVLKEGRNHQIRRMANKIRLTIKNLKRVRIGKISLDNLAAGGFRVLTKDEVQSLKSLN